MIEHKLLIEYLPPFLQEYREYRRLFTALQEEISEGEQSVLRRIEAALDDTFISTATAEGIRRWEQTLSIVPSLESTLDDRREVVRMKLVGERPYTMIKLREMLDKLLGIDRYTLEFVGPYELKLQIELTSKFQRAAATDLIERIIPANILCNITLRYRQYNYFNQKYTHNQMSTHTHSGLKEVI